MNKKIKFGILSIFYSLILLGLNIPVLEISPFIVFLAFTVYTIVAAYVFKNIYPETAVRQKLLFLALFSITQSMFLSYFPSLNSFVIIIYSFVSGLLLYLVLLALNIFIVSEKKEEYIPLIQPAKIVVFVSSLLIVFSGYTIAYKLYFSVLPEIVMILGQFLLILIINLVLFKNLDWFFEAYRVGESENYDESLKSFKLVSVIILLQFAIVTTLYPFEAFARAMLLSASAYVLINYFINYLSHKINTRLYVESLLILIFVYILAYLY